MSDLDKIHAAKQNNAFPEYIDYIRFPLFRNLLADTRIDFEFPITAFVGQNGCGKSSALQALFGAPKGKSVGTYWFNTELDPIIELNSEDRHCFIYSYNGTGNEVLKTRINKKGTFDVWDTSEPIQRYGMVMGTRHSPVGKEVVYINFRAIPNAFEKAFHSERPPRQGIQGFLRKRTRYLISALGGLKILRFKGKVFNAPSKLAPEILTIAGNILGRSYEEATLIEHRLFGEWGASIVLKTKNSSYSDAFAGSGESAVMLLLHEVGKATPGSLLLLDEPETSLHPGAQKKLIDYLVRLCLAKKIQIVFCTHSPSMIADLPKSAIKVFTPNASGKFRVIQNISPQEAFYHIGQPVGDKICIRVEDKLAKLMIDELVEANFPTWESLLEVRFQPGGADVMKQDAVLYMRNNPCRDFLLFDGDQSFTVEPKDPDAFTLAETTDIESYVKALEQVIKDATNLVPKFFTDSGPLGKGQKRDQMIAFIKYLRSHVFFLPDKGPEDMLWNSEVAGNFHLNFTGKVWKEIEDPEWIAVKLKKDLFAELCERLCNSSKGFEIEVIHRLFIKRWLADNSASVAATVALVQQIKDRFDMHKP